MEIKYPELNEGCENYFVLNEAHRSQKPYYGYYLSDHSVGENVPPLRKSPDWKGHAWYRFLRPAGTKMLQRPPCEAGRCNRGHCGTQTQGWMNGTLPQVYGQTLDAVVCFVNVNGICDYNEPIKVRNCGHFFIYELKDVFKLDMAYCATE